MRKLAVAAGLVLFVALPAAVESGVARRQQCEERYQRVYLAARQAVDAVGATVTHSDEGSGVVVGRIEADVYSFALIIDVWISRSNRSGDPRYEEVIWVQVKARFQDIKEKHLDEDQVEQLRTIEDHVFGLIAQRAACGPPS